MDLESTHGVLNGSYILFDGVVERLTRLQL